MYTPLPPPSSPVSKKKKNHSSLITPLKQPHVPHPTPLFYTIDPACNDSPDDAAAPAPDPLLLRPRSNHFLLPTLVSKCGAVVVTSEPAAIMLDLILFLYASTVGRNSQHLTSPSKASVLGIVNLNSVHGSPRPRRTRAKGWWWRGRNGGEWQDMANPLPLLLLHCHSILVVKTPDRGYSRAHCKNIVLPANTRLWLQLIL